MILRRFHGGAVVYGAISNTRPFSVGRVAFEDSKVSADELSSALKNRLKIGQQDLKYAIDTDELNVPKNVSTKYTKDLDKTMPESARHYIVKEKLKSTGNVFMKRFLSSKLNDELQQIMPLDKTHLPTLAHDLEKVLKQKGVHYLHRERGKKESAQFDRGLNYIDKLKEFEDSFLNNFVSPSKDSSLLQLAKDKNKTYYSSTSSMTSTLFQFYMLMNNYNKDRRDRFQYDYFTKLMTLIPSSFIVSKKDPTSEIYSIESDKSADVSYYLAEFGHIAEVILTNETKDIKLFKQLEKQSKSSVNEDDSIDQSDLENLVNFDPSEDDIKNFENFKNPKNVYNVSSLGKFLMRSQLDCYSKDLPGNGTFDLKSRATADIRYDKTNPNMEGTKYSDTFSYRLEYQDLIRTGALLKYSFQARIGQMDGIFVGFHNLQQFFAFEYFKLEDIDKVFFNDSDIASYIAENQFKFSLEIWSHLLDIIRHDLKGFDVEHFRVVLKSELKPGTPFHQLKVNVVPLNNEQKTQLQTYPSSIVRSKDVNEQAQLLKEHKTKLEELNKSTANNVLSYVVDTINWVDQKKLEPYKLPTSTSQKWQMEFRISSQDSDSETYLKHLGRVTGSITKGMPKEKSFRPKESGKSKERSTKPSGEKLEPNQEEMKKIINSKRTKKPLRTSKYPLKGFKKPNRNPPRP